MSSTLCHSICARGSGAAPCASRCAAPSTSAFGCGFLYSLCVLWAMSCVLSVLPCGTFSGPPVQRALATVPPLSPVFIPQAMVRWWQEGLAGHLCLCEWSGVRTCKPQVPCVMGAWCSSLLLVKFVVAVSAVGVVRACCGVALYGHVHGLPFVSSCCEAWGCWLLRWADIRWQCVSSLLSLVRSTLCSTLCCY